MPFPIDPTGHTLILGAPGSGKTTLARRIAGEVGVPLLNASDLTTNIRTPLMVIDDLQSRPSRLINISLLLTSAAAAGVRLVCFRQMPRRSVLDELWTKQFVAHWQITNTTVRPHIDVRVEAVCTRGPLLGCHYPEIIVPNPIFRETFYKRLLLSAR